jgi:hypothetical protein
MMATMELEHVMARLAGGDRSATVDLATAFADDLRRVVRSAAMSAGHRPAADDVDDLVWCAAEVIAAVAGAWRPDGAPPWRYAYPRIAAAVRSNLGPVADSMDAGSRRPEPELAPAPVAPDPDVLEVLAGLVARVPVCALLEEALPADSLRLLLDYRVQQSMGDPSPAHTLAADYGLAPAAVRKRISRTCARLRTLATTDHRFAALSDLPLVA